MIKTLVKLIVNFATEHKSFPNGGGFREGAALAGQTAGGISAVLVPIAIGIGSFWGNTKKEHKPIKNLLANRFVCELELVDL